MKGAPWMESSKPAGLRRTTSIISKLRVAVSPVMMAFLLLTPMKVNGFMPVLPTMIHKPRSGGSISRVVGAVEDNNPIRFSKAAPLAGDPEVEFRKLASMYHEAIGTCDTPDARASVQDEWVRAGGLQSLIALTIAPLQMPISPIASAYSANLENLPTQRRLRRAELLARIERAEARERHAIAAAVEAADAARGDAANAIRLSSESYYASREADRVCRAAEAIRGSNAERSTSRPRPCNQDDHAESVSSAAPPQSPLLRLGALMRRCLQHQRNADVRRDAGAAQGSQGQGRAKRAPRWVDARLVAATAAARRAEATTAAEAANSVSASSWHRSR